MRVIRIDRGNGTEMETTLENAVFQIEGHEYYAPGTIDGLILAGGEFELQTPWANWRFENVKEEG